jgi:hypothetical protein
MSPFVAKYHRTRVKERRRKMNKEEVYGYLIELVIIVVGVFIAELCFKLVFG